VAGANGLVAPRAVDGPVLCQLEIPDEVVLAAAGSASFVALKRCARATDRRRARPADREPVRA